MGKNILITGGAGFVGSFLAEELLRRGHAVRIFDNLEPQVHPKGLPDYLPADAEFTKGDVRDYDCLGRALAGVEVVFHLAAMVGMGQSQYKIKHYVDVNTGGTANLLDLLVNRRDKLAVKKLIVASSMSSYGEGLYRSASGRLIQPPLRTEPGPGRWEPTDPESGQPLTAVPTPESTPFSAGAIYALTKAEQERMVMSIGRTYEIPVVGMRFFNIYGPRQSLSNPYTGVVAIFLSMIKNGKPPVIFEDGLQTRDFISVHDVVAALVAVMGSRKADYQVFNVGTGRPRTVLSVAEVLARVYGAELEPQVTEQFRKGDVRHCYADISRLTEATGWEPKVAFEDGMRELVDWSRTATAIDSFDKYRKELVAHGLI
ncbi:GDP-mannose 4,6-dehydratase [bacterium]|nr:GDP-mannose 4,6-dehydratase [bacterium]